MWGNGWSNQGQGQGNSWQQQQSWNQSPQQQQQSWGQQHGSQQTSWDQQGGQQGGQQQKLGGAQNMMQQFAGMMQRMQGMQKAQQQQGTQPQQQQGLQAQQQQGMQAQQQQGWQAQQQQGWQAQQHQGMQTQQQPQQQSQHQAQQQQHQEQPAEAPDSLLVSASKEDMNEVVVRTLVGEYTATTTNHDRKVYKKSKSPDGGNNSVEVFLYYWDGRDGEPFEGWWFGNQLGGTQVWSQCKQSSICPPVNGWKIPWDGEVRPSLKVESKEDQERKAALAAQQAEAAAKAEAEAKIAAAANDVAAAEITAQEALEQAKGLAGNWDSPEELTHAEALLAPQVPALSMANKKLVETLKGATGEEAKAEFTALSQKLHLAVTAVNTELVKFRTTKQKIEQDEKQRIADERDMIALQEIMPEAILKANEAEDAVEKTVIAAEMIASGTEDMEEIRQAVDQTEEAAKEAQAAIGEARVYLNAQIATCKKFESETVRTQAEEELSKLQTQLQDTQARLNPLKTARQDFNQRNAAIKLTAELKAKLTPAEVDVDSAEEATTLLFQEGNVTKEMLNNAVSAVSKATDHINAALKFIETKKKAVPAQGILKDELLKVEERAQSSINKLAELKAQHKEAQEKITSNTLTDEAAEKVLAVQEAVGKVADAEGPFLVGLEELPLEEALTAVKACETAATLANASVSIARMFIATKLVEVKRFSPKLGTSAKLTEYQKQLETHTKKLADLKKATTTRKKNALMRESEISVAKAEELVQKVAESAACFESDAKLMELSADEVRQAGYDTAKAEVEANAALAEARKFITVRQLEAKGKESSDEVSAMLLQYQTRLSAAQSEVSKYKKLSATVEQRLAMKKSVEEAIEKVAGAEESTKKADELAVELDDISPESVGEQAYADAVAAAEAAAAAASAAFKQVDRYLVAPTRATGGAKEEIAKLQPRVEAARKMLEECYGKMRERAEKMIVQTIIGESDKRVKEVEEAVSKAVEVEIPFVGAKAFALPPEEGAAAFAAFETVAQAAHAAANAAKTFLAMKRLEAKRLAEPSAKNTTIQLAKLQMRLDENTKKLIEVRKGMAERKSEQGLREVAAKVTEAEEKVEAAGEASRALQNIETSPNSSAENAKAECEKLAVVEKESQKAIDDAMAFLVEKQKETKGSEKMRKDLETRLTAAQTKLAIAKRALVEFEQRFVARKLLTEATSMVTTLEDTLGKIKVSTSPLLEEGGASFLADATIVTIIEALAEYMQKNGSSRETLFKEAGGSADQKISQKSFIAYLDKLPAKLGNEDIAVPEDQKDSIFRRVDRDKDGEISLADFESMFSSRYICVQAIAITDEFDISKSKRVVKLEVDDVVDLIGEPRKNEANGVIRQECTIIGSGKSGWVTFRGNQGTEYFERSSPYDECVKTSEKELENALKSTGKAKAFVKAKTNALANSPRGPLADSKAGLMELRPRVEKVHLTLENMRRAFAEAKTDFVKRQELAKDRKAAALLMKGIHDKSEIMNASLEKLVEVAKPVDGMVEQCIDMESVATPLAISAEVTKASEVLRKNCAAVREAIAGQTGAIENAPKGPLREAKAKLAKYSASVKAAEIQAATIVGSIKKACALITKTRLSQVSIACRSALQKKGVSSDACFAELASGQDKISVEAFSKYVKGLESVSFPNEHLKLVTDHIGGDDGINRRAFEQLVQQFFQCKKAIAITNDFIITKSKTVRMLELEEVIEVVEGPTSDEKLGIPRVKGKALIDGAVGWISMKGNQGTPFLTPTQRPCYYCVSESPLEKEFANASGEVRTLKAHEVLEVMEGPRKESFEGAHRAKARACKDGKVGWFVMKSKEGESNVEQGGHFYICTSPIAVTDVQDIKACKAHRKLAQREVISVLEGPIEMTSGGGVHRLRGKSLKDGLEGWITVKGSKGTVYAEDVSSKLYTLLNEAPMYKSFETDGSDLVRALEKGEAIEVIEGPKQEQFEITRMKGRALSDAATGWVTAKASIVNPWSAWYKCIAATEITPSLKLGGEPLGKVAKDEYVEAFDGPKEESDMMRMKVRADKDGTIGWVTLKSAEGTMFTEHTGNSGW